jgi:hypothetical protein
MVGVIVGTKSMMLVPEEEESASEVDADVSLELLLRLRTNAIAPIVAISSKMKINNSVFFLRKCDFAEGTASDGS